MPPLSLKAYTSGKAGIHRLQHPPDSDTPGLADEGGEHIDNPGDGKPVPYVVAVPRLMRGRELRW